jgi:hypothetical protein
LKTVALSSAAGTNAQTPCINAAITNITYATTGATGASVTGLPTSVTGTWVANVLTISGTPSVSGTFNYTVNLSGGCGTVSTTGSIVVTPSSSVSLTSAAGTNSQTPCINTAITNITYATTGATGATVSGLPTGVTGTWTANVLTISGTPSASGTFNYTVNLSGGCGTVSTTGSIVVSPLKTVALSSAAGTNAQTPCINSAITNITYATTGATGATVAGLPTGVTGTWAANVLTISGTPSASGTFNYTINLTGGCGTVSTAGSIVVTPLKTVTLSSASGTNSQTPCINTAITNITYATTGATGASVSGLPTGVTGTWASNVFTIAGTPSASGTFNYTVNLTGGCGTVSATGSIVVTPASSVSLTSVAGTNAQTPCINAAITNITYATTGAIGASVSGLPTGVTGTWVANVLTIAGTPSASGTFNYTVNLTGGCGTVSTAGSIVVTHLKTVTLSSAAGTNSQTPCINAAITNITYATTGATGASVSGLPTGVTGTWASNVFTIAGTPSSSGTFNYTVNLSGGCGTVSTTGSIVVTPLQTVNLSSAAGTNSQTPCINSAITNITYATTGATGASVTGLPTGVTGTWAANVLTISGTPSASGTFNYTVNLSGGCGTVSTTGSIVVTPASSVSLTSAVGTNSQTKYINTAITNITYTTTGSTGATVSGLPTGLTGTWVANVLTISGTPSASGTFNYTVNLTGGCGTLTATGSIIVNIPNPVISYSTYDASTGILLVTGTDFLPLSGVANDIDVTKFSVKGQAGGVFTLTSPNVEITNSTSFTILLNAYDKAAVKLLLNKNGPAANDATIYNLAAAEDWDKGIPTSAIIADLTNNWIIVSNAEQVLPVSLISFIAKSQNNKVLLSWKTSAEHNNSYFRLSHSADGKTFTLLTKVNAAANGNRENTYAFVHLNPVNGNNYYRLEQVDLDGTVKDLGIQLIKFSIAVNQEVKIYPNPTMADVTVSFEKDFFTVAKLLDLNGVILIKKSISINENELSFDMRNLSAGSYLIQLEGKSTTIKKVVKL